MKSSNFPTEAESANWRLAAQINRHCVFGQLDEPRSMSLFWKICASCRCIQPATWTAATSMWNNRRAVWIDVDDGLLAVKLILALTEDLQLVRTSGALGQRVS